MNVIRAFSIHRKPWKAIGERGVTIPEILVGTGILVLAMSGVGVLFQNSLLQVRQTDRAAIAQQTLQIRSDQIRSVGWAKTATPAYAHSILQKMAVPDAEGKWPLTKEAITAYPCTLTGTVGSGTFSVGTTPVFSVTKTSYYTTVNVFTSGSTSMTLTGTSISGTSYVTYSALKFDFLTEWSDGKRTHARRASSIVSKAGSK